MSEEVRAQLSEFMPWPLHFNVLLGSMSRGQFTAESAVFVKIDADKAREVVSSNAVSAFPTFKVREFSARERQPQACHKRRSNQVFKAGKQEVLKQGGFNKAKIVEAMESAGAIKTSGVQKKAN